MTDIYVSALHLDRAAIKALKITDAYSLHRVVYSLFPDVRSEHEKNSHIQSGIVYADQGGVFEGYQPVRKVLMVSDRQPTAQVNGGYGQVMCKSVAADFLGYNRYRFKVQVNPVRKDKRTGKRMAIKGREATRQWFIERAPKSWGFEIDPLHLQVDAIDVVQFSGKDQHQITVGKAHLQGVLNVTNHAQFMHSFKHGIGKARAFGCGLLQIVPLLEYPFC